MAGSVWWLIRGVWNNGRVCLVASLGECGIMTGSVWWPD